MYRELREVVEKAFEFRDKRNLYATKVEVYNGIPIVYVHVTEDEIEIDFRKRTFEAAHGVIQSTEGHVSVGLFSIRVDGIPYMFFFNVWDEKDMEFLSALEKKENFLVVRVTEKSFYGDTRKIYTELRSFKKQLEEFTTSFWTKEEFDDAVLGFMIERDFSREKVWNEETMFIEKGAEDDSKVPYKKVEEVEKTKDEK